MDQPTLVELYCIIGEQVVKIAMLRKEIAQMKAEHAQALAAERERLKGENRG